MHSVTPCLGGSGGKYQVKILEDAKNSAVKPEFNGIAERAIYLSVEFESRVKLYLSVTNRQHVI